MLATVMLSSTGACEAAMTAPESVTPSHSAMPDCPSHSPVSDQGTPLPRGPHQTAPCCALSPGSRISALPEPASTALPTLLQTPAPRAILDVPAAVRMTASPRSSPVRQPAVPPHLLFSVFLL